MCLLHCGCTGKILKIGDFGEVYTALYPARGKWRTIGIKLGLDLAELDDIEESNDNDRRIQQVIRKWLEKRSLNPSWESLIAVLKTREVGREDLAEEIKNKKLSAHWRDGLKTTNTMTLLFTSIIVVLIAIFLKGVISYYN